MTYFQIGHRPIYHPIICKSCNREFIPTNGKQKLCGSRNIVDSCSYKYNLMSKSKYRKNNIEKIKTYRHLPKQIIYSRLVTRIRMVLRGRKSSTTKTLLGCSLDNFKEYLENKFIDNMNWENYGEWHIDHIRPCSSFNLLDQEEQRKCFHYSNLQPLWAKDNLKKGAKWNS